MKLPALATVVAGTLSISFEFAARAQSPAEPGGLSLGDWWLRPSIQLRTRGEYRRPGIETDPPTAVLGGGLSSGAPVASQWLLHERARLGLAVDRGPIGGAVAVQDSRVWGWSGYFCELAPEYQEHVIARHRYSVA